MRTVTKVFGAGCIIAALLLGVEAYDGIRAQKEAVSHAPCQNLGATVRVSITTAGFQPKDITARQCDKLVFQNKTTGFIEVALGQHDHHIAYPGFKETVLSADEEVAVLLTEKGQYLVHDHLKDEFQATLRVE